jgi:hypothetical protein
MGRQVLLGAASFPAQLLQLFLQMDGHFHSPSERVTSACSVIFISKPSAGFNDRVFEFPLSFSTDRLPAEKEKRLRKQTPFREEKKKDENRCR